MKNYKRDEDAVLREKIMEIKRRRTWLKRSDECFR
jgi:hypothetical protein